MIILGIDPGLNNTGWGVVSNFSNNLKYVASGTIINTSATEIGTKLQKIYHALCAVMQSQSPTEVAIEETFVNRNPLLSLKLGYAKGVSILAACENHLKIFEYAPRQIKSAFVGSGKADKDQMMGMLKYLLPLHKATSSHEADALAIAICHINTKALKGLLH